MHHSLRGHPADIERFRGLRAIVRRGGLTTGSRGPIRGAAQHTSCVCNVAGYGTKPEGADACDWALAPVVCGRA